LLVCICSVFLLMTSYEHILNLVMFNTMHSPIVGLNLFRGRVTFSSNFSTSTAANKSHDSVLKTLNQTLLSAETAKVDALAKSDENRTLVLTGSSAATVIKPFVTANQSVSRPSKHISTALNLNKSYNGTTGKDLSKTTETVKSREASTATTNETITEKRKKIIEMLKTNLNKTTTTTTTKPMTSTARAPVVNTTTYHYNTSSEACREIPPGLLGKIKVYDKAIAFDEILKQNPDLQVGGRYSPSYCAARHTVAIIVPYRNRPEQLKIFLGNLHPLLRRQELDYGIYIVNQTGNSPFNRATLLNVGFIEAMKDRSWDCAIFHDVDLLPEDDRNLYNCPLQPRHMSVAIDKFKYKLPYKTIFGGVTAMKSQQFRQLNGYSNEFWGWGGEDDDMSKRIRFHRLSITRYNSDIARYKMIKHKQETVNKERMNILKTSNKKFKTSGLNDLKYKLVERSREPLFTELKIQLTYKGKT